MRLLPLFAMLMVLPQAFATPRSVPQEHLYSGTVLTPDRHPVASATIQLRLDGRSVRVLTHSDGTFHLSSSTATPARIAILVPGFAPFHGQISPDHPAELILSLPTSTQRVVVTADRMPLALDTSANSVQVLTSNELQQSATITLGDTLRQVNGVHLFRRSSTLVANPTSQGVSLRGLGSTAASRTMILVDGIPINDPFGDWIYWDQTPSLAIKDIEVVSGGASDLYGSSAIGGAINIEERQPRKTTYAIDTGYGQEDTGHLAVLGTTVHGSWSGMAAGDLLRTAGYIEVAPNQRGPIDSAANVHYQNGELYIQRVFASGAAFLRGNVLNEARGNGSPLQTNGTRLWRYSSGTRWTGPLTGAFNLKLSGSQEHYRQSFSSVSANQTVEFLTRLQHVQTQQLGGTLQWIRPLATWLTALAGENVNDVRATDFEIPIHHGLPDGLVDTTARQRDIGEYGELVGQWSRWTISGSLRQDTFLNLDVAQYLQTGTGPIVIDRLPDRNESALNPKIGAVRRVNRQVSVYAYAYRAFRSPSINELYRRSQIGQEVTLPNPNLRSERATGLESGTQLNLPRSTSLRAGYFWTEINRPITALTLKVTPADILKRRENLGQIRSRGVALQYSAAPWDWLSVAGGYQYANATVTQFSLDPDLTDKWIPQVPHNSATAQVRASSDHLGTAALLTTLEGRQFDDDANRFLLHGYFQLDGYASHSFGRRLDLYGAVVNMLNRSIEVGRTPVLTLGAPRSVRFGVRIYSTERSRLK